MKLRKNRSPTACFAASGRFIAGQRGKLRSIERAAGKTAENAEKPMIIFGRHDNRKLPPGQARIGSAAISTNLEDVITHCPLSPPCAVVDTQSVLDWLYFDDPSTSDWETARAAGRWRWLASQDMRDELAHVLGRGRLPPCRAGRHLGEVLAAFDARAELLAAPVPSPHNPLRCTDPDDQKFIDFAIAHHARWLVSRDRAVLKLARRARLAHGVEILAPGGWHPARPAADT